MARIHRLISVETWPNEYNVHSNMWFDPLIIKCNAINLPHCQCAQFFLLTLFVFHFVFIVSTFSSLCFSMLWILFPLRRDHFINLHRCWLFSPCILLICFFFFLSLALFWISLKTFSKPCWLSDRWERKSENRCIRTVNNSAFEFSMQRDKWKKKTLFRQLISCSTNLLRLPWLVNHLHAPYSLPIINYYQKIKRTHKLWPTVDYSSFNSIGLFHLGTPKQKLKQLLQKQ